MQEQITIDLTSFYIFAALVDVGKAEDYDEASYNFISEHMASVHRLYVQTEAFLSLGIKVEMQEVELSNGKIHMPSFYSMANAIEYAKALNNFVMSLLHNSVFKEEEKMLNHLCNTIMKIELIRRRPDKILALFPTYS